MLQTNKLFFTTILILLLVTMTALMVGCREDAEPLKPNPARPDTTHFVRVNYIELSKIGMISKFRSGEGHDYSDDFESCRSMKHYFKPKDDVDWSSIKVFSPVAGVITRLFEEWAGTQIQITSTDHPEYTFVLFHVKTTQPFVEGSSITEGQFLGTHIGTQTWSDIAVRKNIGGKSKLVSFIELVHDSVFQEYVSRGMASRNDGIIPKEMRDADPLLCNGYTFSSKGKLSNWIVLK